MNNKIIHITTIPITLKFLTGHIVAQQNAGLNVFCLSSNGTYPEELKKTLVTTPLIVNFSREISILRDIVSLVQLTFVLFKQKPDMVHVHTPKASLLGTIAAKLLRKPCIYHIHGLRYLTTSDFKRKLLVFFEKLCCRLATKVICVSSSNMQVVIDQAICKKEKISVLGAGSISGIDVSHFNDSNFSEKDRSEFFQAHRLPKDAKVIGFVGRLVTDKGIEQICRVWQKLKQEHENLYLLMAGEWESENAIVAKIRSSIEEEPNIILLGQLTDVRMMYYVIDFLIFPSKREGFGMVVLEANAFKKPCVASNIPGCQDAVSDGESGLLFDLSDDDFYRQINQYLNSSELVKKHGLQAYERVRRKFDSSTLEGLLLETYRQILSPD
jgi:glycosyltransferase involved in cell wall biosynthesis